MLVYEQPMTIIGQLNRLIRGHEGQAERMRHGYRNHGRFIREAA
jgi:hypothetical protein